MEVMLEAAERMSPEEWDQIIRKKPKDFFGALSSVMEKRNLIAKPRKIESGKRKRIRLIAPKGGQVGVEITE